MDTVGHQATETQVQSQHPWVSRVGQLVKSLVGNFVEPLDLRHVGGWSTRNDVTFALGEPVLHVPILWPVGDLEFLVGATGHLYSAFGAVSLKDDFRLDDSPRIIN